MNETQTTIQDKDGKPMFADIHNIPDHFWELLTETEKKVIENARKS